MRLSLGDEDEYVGKWPATREQCGDFTQALGLYRKRDETRRLHEHGVLARFRYNDLKETARAADAGPMRIQWWEGASRSCGEAVPQSATGDSRSPEAS